MTLTAVALATAPAAFADPGPALSVDAGAGRHAISPYIYGWNFAPMGLAAQIGLPVDRRGGNSADTLDWQSGFENHANDFYFENIPWCWSSAYSYCSDPNPETGAAHAYTDQIGADRTVGAKSLIDVPMLGYVPKANSSFAQPLDCSFTKANFAVQDDFDMYDPNCGNGQTGHNWVTNTAQTADAQVDTPADEALWVQDLKSRYNDAANGGVAFYELGNEPGLWDSTHHDWHPSPISYDELWNKSYALAAAIKGADPTAAVLAFSEWGWPNYFCSSTDDLSNGCQASDVDRAGHGGAELAGWLLAQFKDWADNHGGQRLIDYLDLHYYRQDGGVAGMAATRSLWDPTYTDQSWIGDQIQLLPRMHAWVDQNYPGTKISLSEYDMAVDDFAHDDHIDQDNLTQADTLGIFAREGLDLATLWPETNESHYADAFRMYRSYDGNHSQFGDTYVSSTSDDQSRLAVYSAQRSSDGALTVLVINKTTSDLNSALSLAGFSGGTTAQVYRWAGAAGGIAKIADQTVGAGGFSADFPSRSMTMFVIPPVGGTPTGGAGTPPGSAPGTGSNTPPTSTPAGKRCVVPKLKGLTLKKAKGRLKKAHCRLGKVTKKRSKARKGRVIAQKPAPKKRLKAGSKVRVVLSRGR